MHTKAEGFIPLMMHLNNQTGHDISGSFPLVYVIMTLVRPVVSLPFLHQNSLGLKYITLTKEPPARLQLLFILQISSFDLLVVVIQAGTTADDGKVLVSHNGCHHHQLGFAFTL